MIHKSRFIPVLFISIFILLPLLGFSQKKEHLLFKSKKKMQKEIELLTKKLDSLQSIIDGGGIQISDTTSTGDSINPGDISVLGSSMFEDSVSSAGCNPDSLLSIWYLQKNLRTQKVKSIDFDSVMFTSNIPDSVYIRKIRDMNSFISIPYNYVVKNYIIYYTQKMPSLASKILGLSSYYMPIFEGIFDEYGLPQELKAMAIIESALNTRAVSYAGAKGMWQFMYQTARVYNLSINSYVDERFDPVKSARAAAEYLRDSYAIFGDWALAISSYNCGTGNVVKAIKRAGSTNFWDVYRYLPRQTRGYIPSFVGALYLLHYYKEYNIVPTKIEMPVHVDTFVIRKNLHFDQISSVIGVPKQQLENLNPQYVHDIIPGIEKPYILRLPYNFTADFVEKEDSIFTYKDSLYFNKISIASIKQSRSIEGGRTSHKVRRGETLGGIAMRYHVSVKDLKRWNGLRSSRIRIGQSLVIYSRGYRAHSSGSSATYSKGGYLYYTVRKGDTLLGIACKNHVSLNTILKLNGYTTKTKIYPGRKLKIKRL
ncbi:MAG: LysM peptidoglycan-binding domain-containing protein [Bacteroidales bacterium]|jgi:membrane-bound lytic murein transglycosylase D|nr:LysM peptidoglycan-binding domain-containing protein [Bacteroidales bacterium]